MRTRCAGGTGSAGSTSRADRTGGAHRTCCTCGTRGTSRTGGAGRAHGTHRPGGALGASHSHQIKIRGSTGDPCRAIAVGAVETAVMVDKIPHGVVGTGNKGGHTIQPRTGRASGAGRTGGACGAHHTRTGRHGRYRMGRPRRMRRAGRRPGRTGRRPRGAGRRTAAPAVLLPISSLITFHRQLLHVKQNGVRQRITLPHPILW